MDAAAGYFGTPVNDQSLTPVITRASASRVSRTGSAATPKHALQRASTGRFCSNRADGASAGYAYYTRYREARVAFREDNAAPLEGGFKASTSSAASSAF
jgi:hypothetical protein